MKVSELMYHIKKYAQFYHTASPEQKLQAEELFERALILFEEKAKAQGVKEELNRRSNELKVNS